MERLFIQVKDGKPFEHPILESNLREARPGIDLDNLPDWLANFTRIEKPKEEIGTYEKYHCEYVLMSNGGYADLWTVVPMNLTERRAKIGFTKDDWELRDGPKSWTFNEEMCRYEPPIPYPDDWPTTPYNWNEDELNWEKVE